MNALLTDLYELNMTASYLRRGMTGTATFSLFVRSLPAARGFLVAAGVESCLDRLEDFRFEEDDIRYLHDTLGYAPRDLEAFRRLWFTGDIWGIPEGRIALAGEPILEVTAPLSRGPDRKPDSRPGPALRAPRSTRNRREPRLTCSRRRASLAERTRGGPCT